MRLYLLLIVLTSAFAVPFRVQHAETPRAVTYELNNDRIRNLLRSRLISEQQITDALPHIEEQHRDLLKRRGFGEDAISEFFAQGLSVTFMTTEDEKDWRVAALYKEWENKWSHPQVVTTSEPPATYPSEAVRNNMKHSTTKLMPSAPTLPSDPHSLKLASNEKARNVLRKQGMSEGYITKHLIEMEKKLRMHLSFLPAAGVEEFFDLGLLPPFMREVNDEDEEARYTAWRDKWAEQVKQTTSTRAPEVTTPSPVAGKLASREKARQQFIEIGLPKDAITLELNMMEQFLRADYRRRGFPEEAIEEFFDEGFGDFYAGVFNEDADRRRDEWERKWTHSEAFARAATLRDAGSEVMIGVSRTLSNMLILTENMHAFAASGTDTGIKEVLESLKSQMSAEEVTALKTLLKFHLKKVAAEKGVQAAELHAYLNKYFAV